MICCSVNTVRLSGPSRIRRNRIRRVGHRQGQVNRRRVLDRGCEFATVGAIAGYRRCFPPRIEAFFDVCVIKVAESEAGQKMSFREAIRLGSQWENGSIRAETDRRLAEMAIAVADEFAWVLSESCQL